MSSSSPTLSLNDGHTIPQLGLGVWQASNADARTAVAEALRAGYRSIDTAAIYENEEGVGAGLIDAGLARNEVYVTTKIWNNDQGTDPAHQALEKSLTRLKLDYVDLLLIHWPSPKQDKYLETWRAMIEMKNQGLVRSIGVSNFNPSHLQRLIDETSITPALNQIELHPYMQQIAMRHTHDGLGIRTESWSPLAQGKALDDATILEIAKKYGKTSSQVIIRWHLDQGLIVIPKSVTPSRIRSNFDVFDFALDADDLKSIAALNRNQRLGPDPDQFA